MTLLGAEDVHSASRNMQAAAEQFGSAVGAFTYQLDRLQTMLNEHAERMEVLAENQRTAARVQVRYGGPP